MVKNNLYVFVFIAVAIIGAFLFIRKDNQPTASLDEFAKCLAVKDVVMYGADWCPHCQNEKRAFGDSFRYVPYIECPKNPRECIAKGIEGYPTWIFPASPAGGPDGKKLIGEQGLQKLSQESGCPLSE